MLLKISEYAQIFYQMILKFYLKLTENIIELQQIIKYLNRKKNIIIKKIFFLWNQWIKNKLVPNDTNERPKLKRKNNFHNEIFQKFIIIKSILNH